MQEDKPIDIDSELCLVYLHYRGITVMFVTVTVTTAVKYNSVVPVTAVLMGTTVISR